MKKFVCLLLLAGFLFLFGCARGEELLLSPFSGACRAQLRGSFRSLAFEALLELDAPTSTGERTATLTFYAPQTLRGTTLVQTVAGEVLLCSGEVRVDGSALAPLLGVFAHTGEVSTISLDNGKTRVTGADFCMEFLSDGTPSRVERDALCAEILSFEVVG